MKIAVPTRNNQVDDHFGHCESYTLFTVDVENRIESVESLPAPQGCGCKSNIADLLEELGVSVMLAGNMGNGALTVLNNHRIKVFRGCTGEVRQTAEAFLKGEIKDSGTGCLMHDHHGEGHTCHH